LNETDPLAQDLELGLDPHADGDVIERCVDY